MNGLDRIGAVTAKEFRHLLRDPRSLALVLLLPIVELLLFAYAISFDVDQLPTIIIDNDRTPASRQYVAAYQGSDLFTIVETSTDPDAALEAFDRNQAQVAVLIPAGFARQLASGRSAQVAVLVDGSESTAARVAQAYGTAVNRLYGQQLQVTWADRQGIELTGIGTLEPRIRTWYNPERRSSDFLIPGLIAVIIAIVAIQQTAVSLVRERDQGTAEQLEVSPLRQGELMIGKLLPWTLLAFADVAIIVALGLWVFDVPLRGDPAVLAIGSTLFVFACLGMGLMISAIAPSMDTANVTAILVAFLPSFLLSGLAFPLDQIPTFLQWVSMAFPARYMVELSRGVFLKGLGWDQLWPQLLALTGYALATLVIAGVLNARRRQ